MVESPSVVWTDHGNQQISREGLGAACPPPPKGKTQIFLFVLTTNNKSLKPSQGRSLDRDGGHD